MYDKLIVYYFSGTGNARMTAKWMVEKAEEEGIPAEVYNIDDHPVIPEHANGKVIVGFCTPTHGFNIPPVMIRFVRKFPRWKKSDAFVFNTRAGMKMYKLFTPGLSGIAQLLPALILLLKGFRIRGLQPMDMPSNWISLHPGIRKKVVDSIVARCRKKTKHFTGRMLAGRTVWKGLLSLPIDLAIVPVSAGYFFVGRFMLAKTFYASYKCTNCGLCERQCPVQAIKQVDKRPYWTYNCESCMRCMNSCPEKAIETSHGLTTGLWILVFSLMPVWLLNLSARLLSPDIPPELMELYMFILQISVAVISVFIMYRLVHYLLRFRFFSYLITFTSLTKLWFWRRYFLKKRQE